MKYGRALPFAQRVLRRTRWKLLDNMRVLSFHRSCGRIRGWGVRTSGKPWDEDCERAAYSAMNVLYFRKSEFRAELSRTFSELPSFFARARSLERTIDGFTDGVFSAEAFQVLQKLREARDLYEAIPDKGPKLTASKFRVFAGPRWMRWFGIDADAGKQKRVHGIDESVWLIANALGAVTSTQKRFADAYRKRRK